MDRQTVTRTACDVGEATYRTITRSQFWFIIGTLSLAMVTAGLQAEIIGDAAPTIAQELDSQLQITWMASSGFLVQVCSLLIFGKLYDLLEPKRVIIVCSVCFTAGSIVSAKAANFRILIVGQALAGLGRSGIVVGSVLILGIVTNSPAQRAFYISIVSGGYGVMLKIAPIISGLVLQKNSKQRWRWIFWVSLPFQILLIILFFAFPVLRRRRATWQQCYQLDFIGAVLQAAALVTFIVPLLIGQPHGQDSWTSPTLIAMYILSPILLSAFIYWDARKPENHRFLPLTAIRNDRSIPALFVITMCSAIIISAATFYLPSYLQTVRGSTPLSSALQQLPSVLLGSLASVVVGKCMPLGGPRNHQIICIIGSTLQIVGGLIFWLFRMDVPWSQYYVDSIVLSIGAGMLFAVGITLVLDLVPESSSGQVSAFMSMATALGSVLGVSIQGVIIQTGTEHFLDHNDGPESFDFQDVSGMTRGSSLFTSSVSGADGDPFGLSLQYKLAYHDTQRRTCLVFACAGLLSLFAAFMLTRHFPIKSAFRRTDVESADSSLADESTDSSRSQSLSRARTSHIANPDSSRNVDLGNDTVPQTETFMEKPSASPSLSPKRRPVDMNVTTEVHAIVRPSTDVDNADPSLELNNRDTSSITEALKSLDCPGNESVKSTGEELHQEDDAMEDDYSEVETDITVAIPMEKDLELASGRGS